MTPARCTAALVAGTLLAVAIANPAAVQAAGEEAAAEVASEVAPGAATRRPARIATRESQEQDMARSLAETTLWVEAGGERFLVVSHPPTRGAPRGNLLFLTDDQGGPDGRARSPMLRRGLARHGWHTFFARLSAAEPLDVQVLDERSDGDERLRQLQALVDGVRKNGTAGSTVLVVEGGIGHLVAPLASRLNPDGLILLNLPAAWTRAPASHVALAVMELPALLVQESPLDWREGSGTGPGVEVHRLPPGKAGRVDDRVLRRIRGWLQRRVTG